MLGPINEYVDNRTPAEKGAHSASVTSNKINVEATTWESKDNPVVANAGLVGYTGEPYADTVGKRSFGLNYSSKNGKDPLKNLLRQFGGESIQKAPAPFFGNTIMNRELYSGEIATGNLYTEIETPKRIKSDDEIMIEVQEKLKFDEIYDDIKKARENDGNWQTNTSRGYIPRNLRSFGENFNMVNKPLAKPINIYGKPDGKVQEINQMIHTQDTSKPDIDDNEVNINSKIKAGINMNNILLKDDETPKLERLSKDELQVGHQRFRNLSELSFSVNGDVDKLNKLVSKLKSEGIVIIDNISDVKGGMPILKSLKKEESTLKEKRIAEQEMESFKKNFNIVANELEKKEDASIKRKERKTKNMTTKGKIASIIKKRK